MKKLHKILLVPALVGSIMLTGCKKDYLDAASTENLSYDELLELSKKDPAVLRGSIGGLSSTMYNTFTGGTTGHDDFGQKSYDIMMDMMAGDMAMLGQGYSWFLALSRLQSPLDFTNNDNYRPWRYYYRQVLGANAVMDILGGDTFEPAADDAVRKEIMGQALAMRAYAYFYLTQFYSNVGYGDGTKKILPITRSSKDIYNKPKSTQKEIWDLMISDLTRAIALLEGYERNTKDQVDQNVAKGLLAYVLAARGTNEDLQKVVELTNDLVAKYPLTQQIEVVAKLDPVSGKLINKQSGFNSVETESWIWGVDLTLQSGLDLVSWWGQVDIFTYSYAYAGAAKGIDSDLQSKFHADDIRNGQFDDGYLPTGKFFDVNRKEGFQRSVTTDLIYMRADEFLLLNAETLARQNKDAEAREALKKLLALRLTNYAYVDALSGDALKDEIFLQTRMELWGEGKVYLAVKRNKRTVTRGANHPFFAGVPMSYDSERLSLKIPQAEILNNPVLND